VSVAAWIVSGAVVWLIAAVPPALVLGRVLRARDRQEPTDVAQPCPRSVPAGSCR
jgi:hypothetical protein